MSAINLIGSFFTSLAVSGIILPLLIRQLHKKNLVDTPDRRKIHRGFIPSLGGVGIFIGIVTSCLLWLTFDGIHNLMYLLIAATILFAIGIRDDVKPIKARVKLIVQIIATILVLANGVLISTDYGLFGLDELNITLCVFLTIGFIVFFTNSFNLIDGLDGLAGTIALISSIFFAIWFYLNESYYLATISLSVMGAVIGFLYFNWQPARIFMGDTGSLTLGFIFAVLGISFMNLDYALSNGVHKIAAPISMMIAVLYIPIFDTFRIIIVRLSKKRSPFRPHNNHIHHVLMRLGLSHKIVALLLGSINIFFILLVITLSAQDDYIVLPIILILSFIISITLDQLIIHRVRTRGGRARRKMKAGLNID